MTGHTRIDVAQLVAELSREAERFCRHFFPKGRKVGNYWQMGDPSGAKGQSLTIRLRSVGHKKAGKWVDHSTSDFGDLLDLLGPTYTTNSYSDALDIATSFLGNRPMLEEQGQDHQGSVLQGAGTARTGCRLFSYGRDIKGTLAERYLQSRNINRFGTNLAFHPNAYLLDDDGRRREFPALLARISDNDDACTGCSRIFLTKPSGRLASINAPKRVLGDLLGNGIRFGPWRTAEDLIIGEGLENTLSVGSALPTAALVSCLTANHLAAFRCPPWIKRIWIAHDNDTAGERAADQLADRLKASGQTSFALAPRLGDFNGDLRENGVTALRQRLAGLISAKATRHDLWPMKEVA